MTLYHNTGWYRDDATLEVELSQEAVGANRFVPVIEIEITNPANWNETQIAIISLSKEDARALATQLLDFANS